jgi:hypothetical protein
MSILKDKLRFFLINEVKSESRARLLGSRSNAQKTAAFPCDKLSPFTFRIMIESYLLIPVFPAFFFQIELMLVNLYFWLCSSSPFFDLLS